MKEDNTPTVEKRKREKSRKQHLRAQNAKANPVLAQRIEKQKQKDERKMLADLKNKKKDNELAYPKVTAFKHKRRQINKSWLPTHVWHAKRARMTPPMEPLWRFAIPLTPTEKTTRVTGRSSRLRGCVAWDASYTSTICIYGPENSILSTLRTLSAPESQLTGKTGSLWRDGARSYSVWLRNDSNSHELIAKPILFWQPPSTNNTDRRLWLRVQPSAFLQLWEKLLEIAKTQNPPIKLEDLRFSIGSIDITGPASTEALTGILGPISDDLQSRTDSAWLKLAAIQDSHSVPIGAILHNFVRDPRYGQPHQTVPSKRLALNEDTVKFSTDWPAEDTCEIAPIFDPLCRYKAVRNIQTQSAINKRKGAALPGHKIDVALNDPHIPVLLLANNHKKKAQSPGSWTLLMPWEYILPAWHSLMHYPLSGGGNPRFGGLEEQHLLCFEDNQPWFPGDFPGTKSGWTWELQQRETRKAEWDRKPKSRRVEWSTLDLGTGTKGEIGLGWACDWESLCTESPPSGDSGIETTGKEIASNVGSSMPKVCQIVSPTLDAPESFPLNGLATISITLVDRGKPLPCARIYRLPLSKPALRKQWLEQLTWDEKGGQIHKPGFHSLAETELIPETQSSTQNDLDEANSTITNYPVVPEASDLVGFLTSGDFNLGRGKGTGIGCIVWARIVNEAKRKKEGTLHGLCIVRNAGHKIGRLARWETIS